MFNTLSISFGLWKGQHFIVLIVVSGVPHLQFKDKQMKTVNCLLSFKCISIRIRPDDDNESNC